MHNVQFELQSSKVSIGDQFGRIPIRDINAIPFDIAINDGIMESQDIGIQ
jgi:hypothetical protein